MTALARLGQSLFGIILVLQSGSAGLTKRLIFGHHGGKTCPVPNTGVNIVYSCPATTHNEGQVCIITCVPGYTLTGSPATISCHNGQWSTTAARCEAAAHPCPVPSVPTNGHVTCASHAVGTQCTVHCQKGYTASSPTISCNSAGATSQWSHTPVCKANHCPTAPKVTNGSYKCPGKPHIVNMVCTLQCHAGFKPSSVHSNIKCHATSAWSAPAGCVPE